MAPEVRLLLACARPGDAAAPSIEGIDWSRLATLAERHRMVMLLGRRLLGRVALPAEQEEWLTRESRAGSARALSMSAELARLLDALVAAGVPAAAYKGPALAVQAYGDASLRRCSDLDVLVPPRRMEQAARIVEAAGYAAERRFTPAQRSAYLRNDADFPFRHPTTGTLVELHGYVSSPRFAPRLDTEEILRRAVPVPIGPFTVPALAEPDLLVALAVHGAKHRWARMEWLASFAALLARSGMTAAALESAARQVGAGRAMGVALEMVRRLLGVEVGAGPPEPVVGELAGAAADRMLSDQPRYDARDTAGNLSFNLRLCDTAGDRARTAWRWLTRPTPEDWNAWPLPDALFPLYRLLRPLRLLGRYGGRLGPGGG